MYLYMLMDKCVYIYIYIMEYCCCYSVIESFTILSTPWTAAQHISLFYPPLSLRVYSVIKKNEILPFVTK